MLGRWYRVANARRCYRGGPSGAFWTVAAKDKGPAAGSSWAGYSALKGKTAHGMFARSASGWIERITYAADGIADRDCLEWFGARGDPADGFQRLLSASAAFTVAVESSGGTINDPVAVAQDLRRLSNSLSRVWRALDRVSIVSKFRANKAESGGSRRGSFAWRGTVVTCDSCAGAVVAGSFC